MKSLSSRRLWALCRKESYQIFRDPSSVLIAFIMPVMMLFVFGYSVNLDANFIRIGILMNDTGSAAQRFEQTLRASKAFDVHRGYSRAALMLELEQGKIRGIVIVQNDFSENSLKKQAAAVQILTDGSEPNTAQFVASYAQGAWEKWSQETNQNKGLKNSAPINIRDRSWFNPSTISRNFLVPGSIAVIMTMIGALLTSLVVAREWERGTMEALLATPVTRTELLLSKIIPYYVLGMLAMSLCLLVAVNVMAIPFRGSVLALFGMTTLFLGSALGLGLFLSTIMRNQFNAAQAALTAAYLPAMMLSGFVFEIASMPQALQWLTHIIPARYFTNALQTLFQAGNIPSVLWTDALFLSVLSVFWLGLTVKKTKNTLD
jgi:ABC-2 type transport system permease protein